MKLYIAFCSSDVNVPGKQRLNRMSILQQATMRYTHAADMRHVMGSSEIDGSTFGVRPHRVPLVTWSRNILAARKRKLMSAWLHFFFLPAGGTIFNFSLFSPSCIA
jgi:hypothetical protein